MFPGPRVISLQQEWTEPSPLLKFTNKPRTEPFTRPQMGLEVMRLCEMRPNQPAVRLSCHLLDLIPTGISNSFPLRVAHLLCIIHTHTHSHAPAAHPRGLTSQGSAASAFVWEEGMRGARGRAWGWIRHGDASRLQETQG